MVRPVIATGLASLVVAVPAKAHHGKKCHTRACKARVAHKQCSNVNPRACVWHVIHHQRITGWKKSWLLRVPRCESTWNPRAYNASGASGLYQFMPGTWGTTPYRRKSIWSAFWQAYAASWMLKRGRAGEWVCS